MPCSSTSVFGPLFLSHSPQELRQISYEPIPRAVSEKMGKEDLQNTMGDNRSSNQHTSFTFIRNDRDGILDALRKLYKGKTTNDRNRTIEQIEILHPAALALAAHCEIPVVELQKIAEAAGKS
jgi:hypothetical protein